MREGVTFLIIMEQFNAKISYDDNNDNTNGGRFSLDQKYSWGDMVVNYCRTQNFYRINSFLKTYNRR